MDTSASSTVPTSPAPESVRPGVASSLDRERTALFIQGEVVGMGLPFIVWSNTDIHLPGNRLKYIRSGFVEDGVLRIFTFDGPFTILRECTYLDWVRSLPAAVVNSRHQNGQKYTIAPAADGGSYYEVDPEPLLVRALRPGTKPHSAVERG